jgi:hypothetical protein
MGKYAVSSDNFTSPTGTADTAISIEMGANENAEVVELIMTGAGSAAPADISHRAQAFFCDFSTAGTPGSSPTPELMRQGSRVAGAGAAIEYTAEPTAINTVAPVLFGFNQRGGMRWAVPRGEGLKSQGGLTEDGILWTVVSNAAGAVDSTMQWWEDV